MIQTFDSQNGISVNIGEIHSNLFGKKKKGGAAPPKKPSVFKKVAAVVKKAVPPPKAAPAATKKQGLFKKVAAVVQKAAPKKAAAAAPKQGIFKKVAAKVQQKVAARVPAPPPKPAPPPVSIEPEEMPQEEEILDEEAYDPYAPENEAYDEDGYFLGWYDQDDTIIDEDGNPIEEESGFDGHNNDKDMSELVIIHSAEVQPSITSQDMGHLPLVANNVAIGSLGPDVPETDMFNSADGGYFYAGGILRRMGDARRARKKEKLAIKRIKAQGKAAKRVAVGKAKVLSGQAKIQKQKAAQTQAKAQVEAAKGLSKSAPVRVPRPASQLPAPEKDGLSTGAIIGIVAGSVTVLAITGFLIYKATKKTK